jgi:hypothetical protein
MAKKIQKPYWDMSAKELAEATREFDGEIPASRLKPLSAKSRLLWERARKGPAKSINASTKAKRTPNKLSVAVDPQLIDQVTDYAKRHNLTVDEVVAKSLKSSLAFVH